MIIKVFIFIICASILVLILKSVGGNIYKPVSILACTMVAVTAVGYLHPTVNFITEIAEKTSFKNNYLEIIFKCTAVCFLGNFATNICRDSGDSSLAYSAEFICRCIIISMTLPIYIDVFNWILKLWENI